LGQPEFKDLQDLLVELLEFKDHKVSQAQLQALKV
jgi:hypothetical protein